ncbi:MAG TPA: DUF4382 domain-containing protein [Gemmatimonadales bacterium]|nr:DUF4382 domain-containing protein [Gemmatimonadales bacterium]
MRPIPALLAVLAVAACSDLGPASRATVDVTMSQSDAVAAQALSGWAGSVADGNDATASISRDTVAALVVRVTSIQFLPTTETSEDEAAWVALDLASPVELDLLDLPTEGASPLVIASGEVEAGEYRKVRLFVDSTAIVFKGPINIGSAFSFAANATYAVDIPSGAQTGLKTDLAFTAEDGADVNLLFSTTSTFANVTATGNGKVMLAPVIRGS